MSRDILSNQKRNSTPRVGVANIAERCNGDVGCLSGNVKTKKSIRSSHSLIAVSFLVFFVFSLVSRPRNPIKPRQIHDHTRRGSRTHAILIYTKTHLNLFLSPARGIFPALRARIPRDPKDFSHQRKSGCLYTCAYGFALTSFLECDRHPQR